VRKNPSHLVTLEGLARITGRTYRTIRDRLSVLEPVKRSTRGIFYDSRKALALIYDDGGRDPEGLDLSRERAALARMQRRKLEIEVARLRGKLVPVEQVGRALEFLAVTFRSRLLALPRKLALQIAPGNPREAESKIETEARAILEELEADRSLPEWITDESAGDRDGDPDGPDGAPPAA
jgi:phage terminase Nu1 subunit (DNA packaging protein)